MSDGALLLGIDGGGTRCRARLRDGAGRLLGEGEAGSANARRGPRAAMDAVVAASRAALAAADLPEEALAQIVAGAGLAGVSQPNVMAETRAEPHPFASLALTTDYAIACLGAHGGADGGIVIVGTGSVAYGRLGDREWRFGGWGFEVSDDGGGAPLGREALRSALRSADGLSPRGPLADAVFGAVGGDPDAAIEWVGRATPADFGRLAPLVLAHAGDDLEAARLLREAGRHVGALVARLAACGIDRVTLVGGLSAPLTPYLPEGALTYLTKAIADPMDGAIAFALREAAS